jgi:hypothetical protein
MDHTADSLFEEHLVKHGEAKTDDTSSPEAAAFQLLLDLHPEHAEELKRLRALGRQEARSSSATGSWGSSGAVAWERSIAPMT